MGKQIEFPKNFKMYMMRAVEHIHTGSPHEALPYLEKAYALQQDHTVNMLYTSTLVQVGDYETALTIAEDMPDFYRKDDKRCLLYVSIMIKNKLFLQAEVIIKRKLKETHSPFYKEWETQQKMLEYDREEEEVLRKNEQKELIKKLYGLSGLSLEEQLHTVEQAEKLDLDTLRKIGSVLFTNPFVHVLAKSAFLQFLIRQQDSTTYRYTWFEEERTVQPTDCVLFDESSVVQEVRNCLEEKLAKNPSLLEMIQAEVEFHLMKLYPFLEEIIVDVEEWINLYMALYDEGPIEGEEWRQNLSEEQATMLSWITRMSEQPF